MMPIKKQADNEEENDCSTNRLFNSNYFPNRSANKSNNINYANGDLNSPKEEEEDGNKSIDSRRVLKKKKPRRASGIGIGSGEAWDWEMLTIKKTKLWIKRVDFIIFTFILTNVILSITENNMFTYSSEVLNGVNVEYTYKATDTVNDLRWACIAIFVVMDILIIVRYYLNLKLIRQKKMACERDGLISTGLWKYLVIELIILSIFSPPYYEGIFSGRMLKGYYLYSWSSILNFLVMFKLYYLVRMYINMSIFLSEKSLEIGKINKLNLNMEFAIKSQLKKYPFLSLVLVFCVSMGICALIIRTFEFGYVPDKEIVEGSTNGSRSVINPDFKSYLDAFWMVVITMMTVGFGDLYPNTHFGRIIAFLSCVVGMFLVSYLIISLSYFIELKPEENKAISLIKIQESSEMMQRDAANVIKNVCTMFLLKSNWTNTKKFTNTKVRKITLYLTQLFVLRSFHIKFLKQLRIRQSISLPSDDILQKLKNKFSDDVKFIAHQKATVKSIKALTMSIIKEEQEIYNGMKNIKMLQNKLSNFLVDYNNKMQKGDK